MVKDYTFQDSDDSYLARWLIGIQSQKMYVKLSSEFLIWFITVSARDYDLAKSEKMLRNVSGINFKILETHNLELDLRCLICC